MDLYDFGWTEEKREKEIEFIRVFLGENATQEQAETLHGLLVGEIRRKNYAEGSTLSEYGRLLRHWQYGEKRFYHDGSDEDRRWTEVEIIDRETYFSREKETISTKDEPSSHDFRKEWLIHDEGHFFRNIGSFLSRYELYMQGFLGIPFVRVYIGFA